VQDDPLVGRQPALHVRMLVGGVVVDDDVQLLAGVGPGDLLEELQEFVVAVPGVAGVGDLPGGDLQGGEQRRGPVPDVVVSLLLGDTRSQRQDRRGPVQRLHLRLLIHAEHHRLVRRIQVQPDNVTHLGFQLGVGGELERPRPERLPLRFRE